MATLRDKAPLLRHAVVFWSLLLGGVWLLGGLGSLVGSLTPGIEAPTGSPGEIARRKAGRPATANDVRHDLHYKIAVAILRARADRTADRCDPAHRRHLVGRIGHLARFRRNNPAIALPLSGPVTEEAVRDAVTAMFRSGYVAIDEFRDDVRDWLFSYAGLGAIDAVAGRPRC